MPPTPPPSTAYLGGSLGSATPRPRRSTVKSAQYRRAPLSACRPSPPSSAKMSCRSAGVGASAGSFGAAASPLPEPRVLSFGGGGRRNRGRPGSPSTLPLLDGEQCAHGSSRRQGKRRKDKKIKISLKVPGKGGASRLVSMGRGMSSALLSAVTRSRSKPSAPMPLEDTEEDDSRSARTSQAAFEGETFVYDGPNFFAPVANPGVTPPRGPCSPDDCGPWSPDDYADEPAAPNGAHSTALGWSCLLALAGSLSLLAGARIVVTYCSDDEDESDEADGEYECQSEGDVCSVPDVDGSHSLDEFMDDDYIGEVDIGPATSTSDMLALGALGMGRDGSQEAVERWYGAGRLGRRRRFQSPVHRGIERGGVKPSLPARGQRRGQPALCVRGQRRDQPAFHRRGRPRRPSNVRRQSSRRGGGRAEDRCLGDRGPKSARDAPRLAGP